MKGGGIRGWVPQEAGGGAEREESGGGGLSGRRKCPRKMRERRKESGLRHRKEGERRKLEGVRHKKEGRRNARKLYTQKICSYIGCGSGSSTIQGENEITTKRACVVSILSLWWENLEDPHRVLLTVARKTCVGRKLQASEKQPAAGGSKKTLLCYRGGAMLPAARPTLVGPFVRSSDC